MSFTAYPLAGIRQAGFGQHAGGWGTPVNADAIRLVRRNSKPAAMPDNGQPRQASGAGAEHGGSAP